MAESTISPNSTAQETLNALNFQSAQIAAGLNMSKQISGQISSVNMNIGKVTAGLNRLDASIEQMSNFQKATNMNIGKVAAAVDRLGVTFKEALSDSKRGQLNSSTMTTKMNILAAKQDETNRILSELLNSFSGTSKYETLENKLESRDNNSLLTDMSASLNNIDETLKRIEKNGLSGGGGGGVGTIDALATAGSAAAGTAGAAGLMAAAKRYGMQGLRMVGQGAAVGLGMTAVDAVANQFIGYGSEPDLKQDKVNQSKMNWANKIEDTMARTVEDLLGLVMPAAANAYRKTRITNTTEYFADKEKEAQLAAEKERINRQDEENWNKMSLTQKFWSAPGRAKDQVLPYVLPFIGSEMADINTQNRVYLETKGLNSGRESPSKNYKVPPNVSGFNLNPNMSVVSEEIDPLEENVSMVRESASSASAAPPSFQPSSGGIIVGSGDIQPLERNTDVIPYFPSSGAINGITNMDIGSAFNTKETLEQDQARIEESAKRMTDSSMVYEASDILYKAGNIRFEASSIQFMGGAMGSAGEAMAGGGGEVGGGGYGPYDNGGGPGTNYSGGDTGGGDTGGGTQKQLSDAQKTALETLEKTGSYTARMGENNDLASIPSDVLGKANVKIKSGPHGDYYSYEKPANDGTKTTEGSTFKDTDFEGGVKGSMAQKAAISRVQIQDQIMKEAKAQGIDISPETAKVMAASIAGQGLRESNYNPKAKHDKENGVYTGFGMYGHRNDRADKAFAWMKKNGQDPNTMESWNRYFAHEIMNATPQTDPQIYSLKKKLLAGEMSLEEATQAVTDLAERPAKKEKDPSSDSMKTRQQGARMAMEDPKRIAGGGAASLTDAVQGNMPYIDNKTSATGPNKMDGAVSAPNGLVFPVTGDLAEGRTSNFGFGRGRLHAGVDIYAKDEKGKLLVGDGANVYSVSDGTIVSSRESKGYGWITDIKDSKTGIVYRYAHIAPPTGKDGKPLLPGAKISKGQQFTTITGAGTNFYRIAQSRFGGDVKAAAAYFDKHGWNGLSKPHLHFETRTAQDSFGRKNVVDPGRIFGEAMTQGGKNIMMQGGIPVEEPKVQAVETKPDASNDVVADTKKPFIPKPVPKPTQTDTTSAKPEHKIPISGNYMDTAAGFSTTSGTESFYASELNKLRKSGKITDDQYKKGLDYITKSRKDMGNGITVSNLTEDMSVTDFYTKPPIIPETITPPMEGIGGNMDTPYMYPSASVEQPAGQLTAASRTAAALRRTESLKREEARTNERKREEKKRDDDRMTQAIKNRESPEPKHPTSTRRQLDSVLVRHNDWYKNFNPTMRA